MFSHRRRFTARTSLAAALPVPRIAVALALGAVGCAAAQGCHLILGLDAYYDCPEDPRCPPPDAGSGGSALSCTTPADCPGGDDCASPICTGGKCGLAARPDGTVCMAGKGTGFRCKGGGCACPAENACGDTCADMQADPANCGGCDVACPSGIACEAGACACPSGGIVCASACVNAQTDAMHCGSCGHACTVAGAACDMGMCVCPGGGTECSGACVDTDTDGMNCGGCGNVCSATLQGGVCSGGTCVCPAPLTACSGVCLDAGSDPLNCGACGHDCLGGGCQAGLCEPVELASGQTSPTDIAVSPTHVYWINPGALTGTVRRVPIGGGTVTTVAPNQTAPAFLVIDGTSVYWTYATGIRKAPLAGGAATPLMTWANGLTATALAGDGSHIYWCMDNTDFSRVPAVGGAGTHLTYATYFSNGLAVDATSIYWSDTILGIVKTLKDGSGANTSVSTAGGAALTIYAGEIYFDGVARVSTAGGAVTTLASNPSTTTSIAVDGTHVYWSAMDGNLRRVPIAGGTSVVLGSGVTRVAVDATYAYWTDASAGRVFRVAK